MDLYIDIINNKYELSNKHYNKIFTTENYYEYLYYFDIMNVYPLFPTIITLKIMNDDNDIKSIINNDDKLLIKSNNKDLNDTILLMNEKIKELEFTEEEINKRKVGMIRKFFSYELVDELTINLNAEYVTVAWLKCYEILKFYDLISTESTTINYFGICEQPGAFIYAINAYVKTELGKEFDFIIQSLVDLTNKKIFKPEKHLYETYKNKYDYGHDKTGDVTKLNNIKYYRKKYYDRHFELISADCGLDCSDDFSAQEKGLLNVIIGQFLLAISLADSGTNYFFKLFTMYEELTKQLIYVLSQLFDNVHICRTLTTKPESGEIYCVCKNFKYTKKYMDTILDDIYKWYDMYTNNHNVSLVSSISKKYYDEIYDINMILAKRRITSMNFLYFRFKNNEYSQNNKQIYEYINELVTHYVKYFIKIYNIQSLEDQNKLVTEKFISKWKKDDNNDKNIKFVSKFKK